MTSPRSAESQLQSGKARVSSESRAQDTPTKVRLIQQILPACRHPDSSRAYLVSGHDRMGDATGFYQTSSFLEVAPQDPQFGPTLMWSTGPGLLIKKRVNYSLCKFLVIRQNSTN